MHIRQLQLTDFRSWPHVDLALEPGVSTLIGSNGQGKTNLLEAVGYLATLGSHRVATDLPLIRHGCERAVVRAVVVNDDRELSVEVEITAGKANRARLNRGAVIRPREVVGILRTILFSPEDLALVRGDPSDRRRFLDELLVARFPRYAGIRADYEKVLRQRNALLKTAGSRRGDDDPHLLSTLDIWDRQLANAGGQLIAGRLNLVADLGPFVTAAYAQVAPDSRPVAITYQPSIGPMAPAGDGPERFPPETFTEAMSQALFASRKSDLGRGVSLIGPHRDELELALAGVAAKGYASHGESWSLALALKLGSYELLRGEAVEPVLLLDDVFAELDRYRRARLAEIVLGAEQVLVTAAVAEDVPVELSGPRFAVWEGQVHRQHG